MSIKKIKELLAMALEQIAGLFEKFQSSGSKTTVLNLTMYGIIALLIALVSLIGMGANEKYTYFIEGIILIFVAKYCYTHIYCLHKNPGLLRRETHDLQKYAIQKGVFGDNLSGLKSNKKEKNVNYMIPEDQSVEDKEDNGK